MVLFSDPVKLNTMQEVRTMFPDVINLVATYGIYLHANPTYIRPLGRQKNYSHNLAAACLVVATTYNNFLCRNFSSTYYQLFEIQDVDRFSQCTRMGYQ
jgi:hypothetical protein